MKKFFCPPCLIGLVLVLGVIGGYYLSKTIVSEEEIIPNAEEEAAEIKEVVVLGTEYAFNPSSITVSGGERVRIIFRNDGRAPHNLIIEGLATGTGTIGGGQTDIIEFTAPQSGTYTFICSVPGHAAAGMTGDLKVD